MTFIELTFQLKCLITNVYSKFIIQYILCFTYINTIRDIIELINNNYIFKLLIYICINSNTLVKILNFQNNLNRRHHLNSI